MSTENSWGLGVVAAFAVVAGSTLATLTILLSRENPSDLVWVVAIYCGAVLLLAGAAIAAMCRLVGARPAGVLATVLVGGAAYSLYTVHLNLGIASIALAVTWAVVFGLLLAATRQNLIMRLLGASALAAMPLVSGLNGPGGAPLTPDQAALLDRYADIRLKDRPNIYLIGFDAMIPREAAAELLDVAPLAYDLQARELGLTVETDVFAAFTPSVESFDGIMTFDDKSAFSDIGYFAGRSRSPLATLFQANGYRVETGSSIPLYFGTRGPAVDDHVFPAKNAAGDSSLCRFAADAARTLGTFGFCRIFGASGPSLLFDEETDWRDPAVALFDSTWHQMVLDRIGAPEAGSPRLGIYYYYYPVGHAPNNFDSQDPAQLDRYRERFKVQSDLAALVIAEIHAAVQARDPGAILVFFGDHGTKISRTIDWTADTAFWVRDHHAVFYAADGDTCGAPDWPGAYRGTSYTTLGRQAASIARCLAANPEDLDTIVEFTDKFDFSKYLLPPLN